MTLPKTYAWLSRMTPLPRMISAALAELGVRETAGAANTTQILRWAVETGLNADYRADSIPWCGLFMAHIARVAGREVPPASLWALSWARFGIEGGQPELGAVLVFMRQGGGHVGLYIGEDSRCYHVLGGNQGDRVLHYPHRQGAPLCRPPTALCKQAPLRRDLPPRRHRRGFLQRGLRP
ncbi:TIGR02594 family protein [Phenylobacterium sp.]|uniref:TIGR02594 family protein n=1 Tax=Phenylobacterium sp. TaxID=1871053 RepID=UPI0025CE0DD6|nr:TIGR02594 family protein [Phenylobacterium sp.]